ncbi:response regulator [Jiulongibacter sp. NS-SX5]|uniref:response regulator n=1 Tax=Jiulongibacter sp. NS-SX5 TaxID=3463854 RepID=UPI004058545D
MTYKILIVDDHQLFGEGLKELLQKRGTFKVYGPLKNKEEIIRTVFQIEPDVVLLDINLGKLDGLDLGKHLKEIAPELKVIMLTMYEYSRLLSLSKQFNMDGYLLKDCESDVLFFAIGEVLSGGKHFMHVSISEENSKGFKDSFLMKYQLSERETGIIDFLIQGYTNRDIANSLSLSYHTVKTHRKNIYLKLGVSNVPELIELLEKVKNR